MNIDDCWHATERDAEGNLQPNAALFPYGMKSLSDYIHSKGLLFGMYTDSGCGPRRASAPPRTFLAHDSAHRSPSLAGRKRALAIPALSARKSRTQSSSQRGGSTS